VVLTERGGSERIESSRGAPSLIKGEEEIVLLRNGKEERGKIAEIRESVKRQRTWYGVSKYGVNCWSAEQLVRAHLRTLKGGPG